MEKKEKRVKLNVIDIIVLVIAVAAVLGVALKMTGHLGGIGGSTPAGSEITYTVKVENIEQSVADNIKAYIDAAKAQGEQGDRCMSSGDLLDFHVTGMTTQARESEFNMSTDGETYISLQPTQKDRVDIIFTIQGYTTDNTITKMGSQEVRVGRTHIVKTTHFEVTGMITTCQWANGTSSDNQG